MRKNYYFKFLFLLIVAVFFASCGSSKAKFTGNTVTAESTNKRNNKRYPAPQVKINTAKPEVTPEETRVFAITSFARDHEGTRYKFGGTTKKGMDCSGLVYTSFLQENIALPRSSRDMAKQGRRLELAKVNIGDLLFFETDKNKKVINHVGLVVEIQPGQIFFIHSTSSRGVIISSLAENYWFDHFVMARRVI